MRAVQRTIKHWEHVVPYTHIPHNEKEYKKLMAFVDELMEWSRHHQDEHATSLLTLIAGNIETYENHHYRAKKISSIEMLKFLMDEHGLGQGDLPEIGSQSLVSKILNGERQLLPESLNKVAEYLGWEIHVKKRKG